MLEDTLDVVPERLQGGSVPDEGRLQFAAVDASGDAARHATYLAALADIVSTLRTEAVGSLGLRPGAALLDAGCGAGEHAIELVPRVLPDGRIVGVDTSRELVDRARAAAGAAGVPVDFLVADIRDLPFADSEFDAVRSERVFQHLEPADGPLAAAELLRVTRPRGVVQLSDPNHFQTAFTATDRELARCLVVEGRTTSRHPDAGLHLHALLHRAGAVDVTVEVRPLRIRDLAAFDTLQELGRTLDALVTAGSVEPARAAAFRADLEARDRDGTFLATIIAYCATGRKPRAIPPR